MACRSSLFSAFILSWVILPCIIPLTNSSGRKTSVAAASLGPYANASPMEANRETMACITIPALSPHAYRQSLDKYLLSLHLCWSMHEFIKILYVFALSFYRVFACFAEACNNYNVFFCKLLGYVWVTVRYCYKPIAIFHSKCTLQQSFTTELSLIHVGLQYQ